MTRLAAKALGFGFIEDEGAVSEFDGGGGGHGWRMMFGG
jgi:hypothetical protein